MEGNVKDEHKRDYCRRIKSKIMAGWGSSEINRWRKYNSLYCKIQKPVTGELNDEQLRDLDERLKYLRNLEEKKNTVIASIEEQGKNDSWTFEKNRKGYDNSWSGWHIQTLQNQNEKQEPRKLKLRVRIFWQDFYGTDKQLKLPRKRHRLL